MKKVLAILLLLGGLCGVASAQTDLQLPCKTRTLTETGRVLLLDNTHGHGGVPAFGYRSGQFFVRYTGAPDSTSISIEAGAEPLATATPATKLTATGRSAQVEIGQLFGKYGYIYANLTVMANGTNPTAIVTSCFDTTLIGHAVGTKGDVGLGNVDNTSDANKPVSSATQSALNAKLATPVTTFANITSTCTGTETFAIASAWIANAVITTTGSCVLNITNPLAGGNYVVVVIQGAGGSHTLGLGTGCTWKVSGGGAGAVTPSTGAGAIDILAFTYDGANCYANYNKNFS